MTQDSKPRQPEWHPEGADKAVYASEVVPGVETRAGSTAKERISKSRKTPLDRDALIEGIQNGDRVSLARAITCVESESPKHRLIANDILRACLPVSGKSIRVGITGVPGAGKSQFIETLGRQLCSMGKQVAVLAVDPSSSVTGGSILGDKTRMEGLCRDLNAFIRPSPAGKKLGGVAAKTRESIFLCEAAGYEVILIETVGVGQSEVAVRSMVDFFLLLQIAGAGDELQGIKKGVIEMADAIVVNKSDGENVKRARVARGEYERVLQYLHPYTIGWSPKALACSALEGTGVEEVWEMIESFCKKLKEENRFEKIRSKQNAKWFRRLLEERVLESFFAEKSMNDSLAELNDLVSKGEMPVVEAVDRIMAGELNSDES